MYRFFESLTAEEKALLHHLSMDYLDTKLDEGWDENTPRINHDVQIEGKTVGVEGFSSPHYALKSYKVSRMDTDFDVDILTFISRIANHQEEKKKVFLEEYHKPSFGVMLANQSNGSFDLFDYPANTQHAISLEFSDARISGNLDGTLGAGDEIRISGGKNTLTVQLAPEQYVRFVRSQSVKVPCTINRRSGYLNDAPDTSYLVANQEGDNVKQRAEEAVKPLYDVVEQIADMLASGKMTSAKRLSEVESMLEVAESSLDDVFAEVYDAQTSAVSEIQKNFMGRMINHIETEINSLPDDSKAKMIQLMKDVTTDL